MSDLIELLGVSLPPDLRADPKFFRDIQLFWCGSSLTQAESFVLLGRAGLLPGSKTRREIGKLIDRCEERVVQIERSATRKLKQSLGVTLTPQLVESELCARSKPGKHDTSWSQYRRMKRFTTILQQVIDSVPVLERSIYDLKLHVRVANTLADVGISTIGGLVQKTEEEVRSVPGLGPRGVQLILEALTSNKPPISLARM